MALKTNYVDDLFSGDRKFEMTRNQDGTVSFTDETEYTREGDVFGASDINATNTEVNRIASSMVAIQELTDAQYEALSEAQKMNGTLYDVGSENDDDAMEAAVVNYDNTDSGLQAEDVQGAIDEVSASLTELDTIRYNEETDWIQCKINGVYVNYKKAYLKDFALFLDGQFASGYAIGAKFPSATNPASLANDKINVPFPSANSKNGSYIEPAIDCTNYDKCTVTYYDNSTRTVEIDISSLSGEAYFGTYIQRGGTLAETYLHFGFGTSASSASFTREYSTQFSGQLTCSIISVVLQ